MKIGNCYKLSGSFVSCSFSKSSYLTGNFFNRNYWWHILTNIFFPFLFWKAGKKRLTYHFSCLPLHSSTKSPMVFNWGFQSEFFLACVLLRSCYSHGALRTCLCSIRVSPSPGKLSTREGEWARGSGLRMNHMASQLLSSSHRGICLI